MKLITLPPGIPANGRSTAPDTPDGAAYVTLSVTEARPPPAYDVLLASVAMSMTCANQTANTSTVVVLSISFKWKMRKEEGEGRNSYRAIQSHSQEHVASGNVHFFNSRPECH